MSALSDLERTLAASERDDVTPPPPTTVGTEDDDDPEDWDDYDAPDFCPLLAMAGREDTACRGHGCGMHKLCKYERF